MVKNPLSIDSVIKGNGLLIINPEILNIKYSSFSSITLTVDESEYYYYAYNLLAPTYNNSNLYVNWGDSSATEFANLNFISHTYKQSGIYNIKISGSTSSLSGIMCDLIKNIDISTAINLKKLSLGATSLDKIDLTNQSELQDLQIYKSNLKSIRVKIISTGKYNLSLIRQISKELVTQQFLRKYYLIFLTLQEMK
jgi:hypothetical protein